MGLTCAMGFCCVDIECRRRLLRGCTDVAAMSNKRGEVGTFSRCVHRWDVPSRTGMGNDQGEWRPRERLPGCAIKPDPATHISKACFAHFASVFVLAPGDIREAKQADNGQAMSTISGSKRFMIS